MWLASLCCPILILCGFRRLRTSACQGSNLYVFFTKAKGFSSFSSYKTKHIIPPKPNPLFIMRTLYRFSRQASKFTPLTTRRPLAVQQLSSLRIASSQHSTEASPSSSPQTQAKSRPHAPPVPRRPPQPEYEMTFTCKPCSTRSTHRVSKQGYHYGSVLITCPECRNRHVISDHLKVGLRIDMMI